MNTFSYFAYGSNLLSKRIHIKNPTAIKIGIGKLNDFRLDFNGTSNRWNGSPATIVPDAQQHVWGVIWQLNITDLSSLDQQESVKEKVYTPFEVNVVTPDGENILCRCYKLVQQPTKQIPIPHERRPSKAYLETIILGARENNLPLDYLQFLSEIPDNGNDGPKMPWSTC